MGQKPLWLANLKCLITGPLEKKLPNVWIERPCEQVLWLGGNTADPRNWTGVGLFYLELVNVGHEDLSACHFRKQLLLWL